MVKRERFIQVSCQGRDLPQASCLIRVEGTNRACKRRAGGRDMSLSTILLLGTTSGMPSLLRVQSTSVQQPHFEGTGSFVHSGPWEAQHKVQPVQFFVKGKVGVSTSVVRGCLEEVLSQVVGTDGLDVYVTMNGKILDLCSTLKSCGITDGCTVHVHFST